MDPDAGPSGNHEGGALEVFAGDSFSPSPSPRRSPSSNYGDDLYEKEAFDPFDKEAEHADDIRSGDLSDGGDSSTIATSENGKSWGRDNDNASTTSSEARTRKSIERDALRRYVRQRYRKRG